jgi:hypothetical protein
LKNVKAIVVIISAVSIIVIIIIVGRIRDDLCVTSFWGVFSYVLGGIIRGAVMDVPQL